ncbi:hypothetical protein F5Y17DRAFT_225029 [Xylariaceae sp. FL0594]|nr:hypothetical protein F5Y17DRAFT_225029 [Xylariaceae sp. FL0594]
MEITVDSPTGLDRQSRKRKGRNSEVRKEQNRIASRAYREKRKQKLALLDEILKSDSHTDSMSSVSDETEFKPTTPAPDFLGMEIGGSRQSSHSPSPFYLSSAPAMSSESSVAAVGIQPLPSNGPSRDPLAFFSYPVNGYAQETVEYAHGPSLPPVGVSSGYVSPQHSVPPMPPTSMFPFEDEYISEPPSSIYPVPDETRTVPGFSTASGYDPNMMNAIQSLSRLTDSQQEDILVFLQKRRSLQMAMADHSNVYGFRYSESQVPTTNSVPGM